MLTSPPLLDLLGPLGGPPGSLLLLLLGATPVKVLNDDTHEHVKHEKTHEKQERYEVDQAPFVEILARLEQEQKVHEGLKRRVFPYESDWGGFWGEGGGRGKFLGGGKESYSSAFFGVPVDSDQLHPDLGT